LSQASTSEEIKLANNLIKTAQEDILSAKTFLKENQLKEETEQQKITLDQQKANLAE